MCVCACDDNTCARAASFSFSFSFSSRAMGDVKQLFCGAAHALAQLYVVAVKEERRAAGCGYRRALGEIRDFVEERRSGPAISAIELLQFLAALDTRERHALQLAEATSPPPPPAAAAAPPPPRAASASATVPVPVAATAAATARPSRRPSPSPFGAHFSRAVGANGPEELLEADSRKRVHAERPTHSEAAPGEHALMAMVTAETAATATATVAAATAPSSTLVAEELDILRFKRIKLDGQP
jgi:hypothetical protein